MTEKQARDAGLNVRVAHNDLAAASTRGWIARAQGLIKLVEDADRGVLVGATTVGPERRRDALDADHGDPCRGPDRHACAR